VTVGRSVDARPAAPQQRRNETGPGLGVDLGGSWLQGNVGFKSLNSAVTFEGRSGPHQFFSDTSYYYAENSGATIIHKVSESMLYAYALNQRWNLYYYSTHLYDRSIDIKYRLINGGGLCRHRIWPKTFKLFLVSAAVAPENEWFISGGDEFTLRVAPRLNIILPIGSLVDVGVDSFVMPSVRHISDYRFYNEGFVQLAITKWMSLRFTVADEYDAAPPAGVKKHDVGYFTTLHFDWRFASENEAFDVFPEN
jgi:hypothetical protein